MDPVALTSFHTGLKKAEREKEERDYLRERRGRQRTLDERSDEQYGLDKADAAHRRERGRVDEARADEQYERALRDVRAKAEAEGLAAMLPHLERGNVAEAERQFNLRGEDRIVAGSLKFDPKTKMVSAVHEQSGQAISMSLDELRELVHGPAKPAGTAKLGQGDRLVDERTGRVIAENPKPADPNAPGGGGGGFGFGGKPFDDLQSTYKAVESHLAQRFGGRYDSQTQQIIGIPPENSDTWSEATSVAQDLLGAAAQGGVTPEVLPYATVADIVARSSSAFVPLHKAVEKVKKSPELGKVPPEQREAWIQEQAMAEVEASRIRWREGAVKLTQDVLAQRQKQGAGPAAPAAGAKPAKPAAAPGTATAAQKAIPADLLTKAQAKIKENPGYRAGVVQRLKDMGYTEDAIKAAGL